MLSELREHRREEQGTTKILFKIKFDNRMVFAPSIDPKFSKIGETPTQDRRQGEELLEVRLQGQEVEKGIQEERKNATIIMFQVTKICTPISWYASNLLSF